MVISFTPLKTLIFIYYIYIFTITNGRLKCLKKLRDIGNCENFFFLIIDIFIQHGRFISLTPILGVYSWPEFLVQDGRISPGPGIHHQLLEKFHVRLEMRCYALTH